MAKDTIKIKELNSSLIANRDTTREHLKSGKTVYKVPFSSIKIRDGWNARTDMGDIEGLAKSILENGLQNPLKGDLMEDGTFIPSDGHRRYEAIKWLNKNGHEFVEVEAILNSTKMSDEQRLLQMWVANDGKELTALEKAEVCKRLMTYGYKPKDIADKLGVSRMQVDNYITLSGLSIEEKEAVAQGTIKPTAAVKLSKQVASVEERKTIIKTAKAKGNVVKQKDVQQSTSAEMIDEILADLKKLDKMVDGDGQDIIFEIDKKLRVIKKAVK
jgi:ParB/RepB/Spo0J family partition protein